MGCEGASGSASIADPIEIAFMRARIDRATAHRTAFGEVWATHLDRQPRRTEVEITEDGEGLVRIIESEPIPAELSLLLGEFLYELRAALDNCLYAVAVLESQQRPPPNAERLEWPICLDERSWTDHAHRRLSALSPAVQQALANIQPFKAECPEWNCLRILHDLARIDRHRTAHLAAPFLANAKAAADLNHVADLDVQLGIVPEDGVVATFRKVTPGPLLREHLDLDLTFDIEIAEVQESPSPVTGRPQRPWGALDKRMLALLRAVIEYTDGLIAIARQEPDAPDPFFGQS